MAKGLRADFVWHPGQGAEHKVLVSEGKCLGRSGQRDAGASKINAGWAGSRGGGLCCGLRGCMFSGTDRGKWTVVVAVVLALTVCRLGPEGLEYSPQERRGRGPSVDSQGVAGPVWSQHRGDTSQQRHAHPGAHAH